MKKINFLFSILLIPCVFACKDKQPQADLNEPNINYFTIKWVDDKGTLLEMDQNVPEGSIPSYDGPAPIKEEDDLFTYVWKGWSPEIYAANKDETYTATFKSERIKYTIDFDLNGGISESYAGPKKVEELSKSVFFFDCVKDNWTFRGWKYKGNKIFDEKGNQLSSVLMEKEMVFVADYSQTAILTINTNIENAGKIIGCGEYSYNTYVDISVEVNSGYSFIGWYQNDNLLSSNTIYKYMLWNEDATIEARFSINSYLLRIWSNSPTHGLVLYQNQENNEYNDSYQKYFDYSTAVTVAAYSKTNVEFLGWYNSLNQLVETNSIYSFTMPSYDFDLEAKWDYFTITYNLYGGTNNSSNLDYYNKDMSIFPLYEPTKAGYDFIGWKCNDEFISEINPSLLKNISLDAVWVAHEYTITYILNDGTNNYNNPTTFSIESGPLELLPASKNGYTFVAWCSDSNLNNEISNPYNPGIGDKSLYAKYIPTQYLITYNTTGGSNSSNNPQFYTIEDEIILSNASRTGYTFNGWYNEEGNQVTTIYKGTTGAIVLTAHWIAKQNNLSVISDNNEWGTVQINSGSGYSGEIIEVEAIASAGYVFMYWIRDYKIISKSNPYRFRMGDRDYSMVAHFLSKSDAEQYYEKNGIKPIESDDGATLKYGLYPQSNISSNPIPSDVSIEPDENGLYFYKDRYYVKLTASPYKTGYTFGSTGNTIVSGKSYWFRCEPIVWKKISDGLYLSQKALDCHYFNHSRTTNIYGTSDIASWLSNIFKNTAFKYTINGSGDIGLLSKDDYINTSYGFPSSSTANAQRYCYATDYALARGSYMYVDYSSNAFYRCVQYMTSSPFPKDNPNDNSMIYDITPRGEINGGYVDFSGYSVRPYLKLDF